MDLDAGREGGIHVTYSQRADLGEQYIKKGDLTHAGLKAFLKLRGGGRPAPNLLCESLLAAKPASGSAALVWPTLVIGSECLRVRGPEADGTLSHLPSALTDELSAALSDGRRGTVESVYTFVRQLLEDRLGIAIADAVPAFGGTVNLDDPLGTVTDAQREAEVITAAFDDWHFDLMIAAAALTECYFGVKATTTRSVSRWGQDPLPIIAGTPSLPRAVEAIQRLEGSLEEEARGDNPPSSHILTVASGIGSRLNRRSPVIRLADLQALTEITWHQLLQRSPLWTWYPEWHEFLVTLSLHEASAPIRQGSLRPAVGKTEAAADIVREALAKVIRESAQHYAAGDHPDKERARVEAYATYARLLRTEVEVRRGQAAGDMTSWAVLDDAALDGPPIPILSWDGADATVAGEAAVPATMPRQPPASAFVTTFDIELEMALCNDAPGEPFVIALPVNLEDNLGGSLRATPLWLGCVVDYRQGDLLTAITEPPEDAWFVFGIESGRVRKDTGTKKGLHIDQLPDEPGLDFELLRGALPAGVRRLGELPVVVRLVGCPIIKLPRVQRAEASTSGERPDEVVTRLGQAIITRARLDGSLRAVDGVHEGSGLWRNPKRRSDGQDVAFRLVHATLLDEHNAIRLSLPEVATEVGLGLPPEITDGCSNGYWRYWVLAGVELSDPVIRYRFVSQLLGTGLVTAAAESSPAINGLALNRKALTPRAADLLAWAGFDIVTDGSAPQVLTEHVEHLRDHLRAGVPWAADLDGAAHLAWPTTSEPRCSATRNGGGR